MNICGHYFCWVFFCYDNIKNIKYAINNFINKAFNKAYRDNKKVRDNTNKALSGLSYNEKDAAKSGNFIQEGYKTIDKLIS